MRAEGMHGAKKQLESINYDISSCEEQLKLIQRLKVPKEKRRELAEAKPLFQMTRHCRATNKKCYSFDCVV